MRKSRLVGLIAILVLLSSSSTNMWTASAVYDHVRDSHELNNVQDSIFAPHLINMSQLSLYEYHNDVSGGKKYRWKVDTIEKTDNFDIAEGDKNLKKGDKVIADIGSDPELQLDQPHVWCLIYVNDVMARFPNDASHGVAVFKFVQPIGIDYWENFTDPNYNSTEFLDYYEANYNYTDFAVTHYNKTFFYNVTGYFNYLETSPFINSTLWSFEDDVVRYTNRIKTEVNNITDVEIVYDRETGFMNELYYTANFINGTGHFAGVNLTLIRLHGWGLPYTITTWVVWIPILLITVGLIVAIRMRAFQRLRLYLEARKLAQRD
jgi:hypothetical protein